MMLDLTNSPTTHNKFLYQSATQLNSRFNESLKIIG
jgi:hypothetical protein